MIPATMPSSLSIARAVDQASTGHEPEGGGDLPPAPEPPILMQAAPKGTSPSLRSVVLQLALIVNLVFMLAVLEHAVKELLAHNFLSATIFFFGGFTSAALAGRGFVASREPTVSLPVSVVVSAPTVPLPPAPIVVPLVSVPSAPAAVVDKPMPFERFPEPLLVRPMTKAARPGRWLVIRRKDGFELCYPLPELEPDVVGWYFGDFTVVRSSFGSYFVHTDPGVPATFYIFGADANTLFERATIAEAIWTNVADRYKLAIVGQLPTLTN